MESNDQQLYEALVAKYSKAYYSKVKELFSIEDLAQELWVTILEAEEEYNPKLGTEKSTYLVTCIQNKIVDLVRKEMTKRRVMAEVVDTVEDDEWEADYPQPDALFFSKELYDKLKLRVQKIKYGEFILNNIHLSSQKISDLAKERGIPLPKSTVIYKVKKIKEMLVEMGGSNV